jgi:hypothetical protein
MLDDVERRRLLVEPAREDSVEGALRVGDVQLDEGAGQLLDLPGRGRLAGAEANDDVADAQRLARLHRQVALDAVAFVEEADHRDPLRHRRRPRRFAGHRLGHVDRLDLGRRLAVALPLGRTLRPAGGERRRQDEDGTGGDTAHASSGVQAS